MEWMEFALGIITLIFGGGWLFTWRSHKRSEAAKAKQEEEKAKQEAASAKQQEADAFKSMQDAYQQTLEDVKHTLEEVRCERDHYKDERNELRKENTEMRKKYVEIENRMNEMEMKYKKDFSRLGRRVEALSPFLCGRAGCVNRTKVSLMEDIDDESFDARDDSDK